MKVESNNLDNPIAVNVVPVSVDKITLRGRGDDTRLINVIAGISFLLNLTLPFKFAYGVPDRECIEYVQARRWLFDKDKGPWREVKRDGEFRTKELFDTMGVTYAESVETYDEVYYDKGGYNPNTFRNEKACYRRSVNYIHIYSASVSENAVKSNPELLNILKNGKNNTQIQGMIEKLLFEIPSDISVESISFIVKYDRVEIYAPRNKEFKLKSFGLADCSDTLHRYALLSMIAAGILIRRGNEWGIHTIFAGKDSDGRYWLDECEVRLLRLKKIEKKYQEW